MPRALVRLVLTEYDESHDNQLYIYRSALLCQSLLQSSHCLSFLPTCCCPSSLILGSSYLCIKKPSSPRHSQRRLIFSTCGPGPGPGPGPAREGKGSFPSLPKTQREVDRSSYLNNNDDHWPTTQYSKNYKSCISLTNVIPRDSQSHVISKLKYRARDYYNSALKMLI